MNTQNPARSCGTLCCKKLLGFGWKNVQLEDYRAGPCEQSECGGGLNPPRGLDTAQVPVLTLDALQGRDMGLLSVLLSSDNGLSPAGNINGAAQLGK